MIRTIRLSGETWSSFWRSVDLRCLLRIPSTVSILPGFVLLGAVHPGVRQASSIVGATMIDA